MRCRRYLTALISVALLACAQAKPVAGTDAALASADSAGETAGSDSPVTVAATPAAVSRVWLGVAGLPENMMGNAANGTPLHWAVPRQGFSVDVHAQASGDPITAPVLTVKQGDQGQATALNGLWQSEGKDLWRWSSQLTDLAVGLTEIDVALGSQIAGIIVQVADRTPQIDPFETIDPWLLTFSRDTGGVQVVPLGDSATVTITDKPNGKVDFDETLAAFGLQGGDPAFNTALRALFLARLRQWLHTFYLHDPQTGAIGPGSIRVQFLFEGDPELATIDPGTLSKMAIGGVPPVQPDGKQLFGLATIDIGNHNANDDSVPGLGVFTFSMVRAALAQPVALTLLQGVLPALGGQPFGALPTDTKLLDLKLDVDKLPDGPERDRAGLFLLELRLLSLAVASVTAHEMGHSLGMIAPGMPPHGLLGGVAGPWVIKPQDQHHIDTIGPNLMQTGDSFDPAELLTQTPAFSPLEGGYLRRQLLILP